MSDYILGIDTSNYTTSIAAVDKEGKVLFDCRKILDVKKGGRGLRQSEALFQHVKNLPILYKQSLNKLQGNKMAAVSVSTKPRPTEGSYMPVFKAGESFASVISDTLNLPIYSFSHQEGHISAVRSQSHKNGAFLCFQMSGGTCELLLVNGSSIKIIGGSDDISLGQVIDRIGVSMGMGFPSGNEMDMLALSASESSDTLTEIKVKNLYFNLSGIETQAQRSIGKVKNHALAREIFEKISKVLENLIRESCRRYECDEFVLTGGVSSSKYLQKRLVEIGKRNPKITIYADAGDLGKDNAVGIARLGGMKKWL